MRRCRVPSCPVVAVLLLTFGCAACQDTKTPATNCSYKENGVRKPCAIFEKVECKTIGLHTLPDDDWFLRRGKIDGMTYYNATFCLWAGKGYFAVEEDDECWKFQTGDRQYPEKCVRVKLDYFPIRKGTGINVWGDDPHCSYLYSSPYNMQYMTETKFSCSTNKTFEVHFKIQTLPEIQQLGLVLLGGECEVNCDGRKNGCKVSLVKRSMTNVSEREVFTGLKQGYYCLKIKHGDCAVHTSTRAVIGNSSCFTPAPPDSSQYLMTLVVCLSITVVALIIIIVICLKKRIYGTLRQLRDTDEEDPPTKWQIIQQQWASSPDAQTELLLLYSRDCREFCDVMQAFGQLLKSFGNMKVLDPMAQNQMEKVSENISGWLAHHLRNPDVKVVIVVSEGAKQRQRALLNNQIVRIAYPHFMDHIYTQALQQMHQDANLGSDYTRIFPVRFEDFTRSEESLSLIVPLKCYVLQKHLGKLILELRGFNASIGPDLEDIRSICPKELDQLESTIRIMESYCALNPHYISKHFSIVAPAK